MKKVAAPTFQDWDKLQVIVDHVEMIVCDAYDPNERDRHKGLLGLFAVQPALPTTASKLRTASVLSQHLVDQVLAVLPGADNLGVNRRERIDALTGRLKELTAYQWLMRQPSYTAAVKLIQKKAAASSSKKESIGETLARTYKLQQGYAKDTSEYLLLKAFLAALALFLMYREHEIEPPFPTKAELEKALLHAKQLSQFLCMKFMVSSVVEISPFLEKNLNSFVLSTKEKLRDYTKPKADETLTSRIYQDRIIQGCWLSFGDCSPTLIQHLLGFVEYEVDPSDLSKKIKAFKVKLNAEARLLQGQVV